MDFKYNIQMNIATQVCRCCLKEESDRVVLNLNEDFTLFELTNIDFGSRETTYFCLWCLRTFTKATNLLKNMQKTDQLLKNLAKVQDERQANEMIQQAMENLTKIQNIVKSTKTVTVDFYWNNDSKIEDNYEVINDTISLYLAPITRVLEDKTANKSYLMKLSDVLNDKESNLDKDKSANISNEFDNEYILYCKDNHASKKQINNKITHKTMIKEEGEKYKSLTLGKIVMISLSFEEQLKELNAHRETYNYLNSPYKCEFCAKHFAFEDTYREHMLKHEKLYGKYQCKLCTQYFPTILMLRNHGVGHSRRYRCVECGITKTSHTVVSEHYLAEHTNNMTILQKINCELCTKTFNKLSIHKKHMRVKHAQPPSPKMCSHCEKTFASIASLRTHMLKHSDPQTLRLYKCAACDSSFHKASKLRHHQLIHRDVKSFYCVECNVYFKSRDTLKQHLRRAIVHLDPALLRVECNQCIARFHSEVELKRHIDRKHLRKKMFACSRCTKSFFTSSAMRKHERCVHLGYQRPKNHKCNLCEKAFSLKATLTSHMNTHTGERPYACPKCPATFGHSGPLYTHNKLVHLKIKRTKTKETTKKMIQE